jgi:hypothetical protein
MDRRRESEGSPMGTTAMSAALIARTREQAADILQVVVIVLAGIIILTVAWESFRRKK